MEIIITHHGEQFNVELASKAGADPFLSIKGCRLVNGDDGPFVSYPATKNANTGKWWRHAWGSDAFNAAVLAKVQASAPKEKQPPKRGGGGARDEEEIPFDQLDWRV